jgi:hypothetical protein
MVKSHRRALFTAIGTTVTPLVKGIPGLIGLVAAYTMPRVEEMHPDALARADAKDAEDAQAIERLSQRAAQFAGEYIAPRLTAVADAAQFTDQTHRTYLRDTAAAAAAAAVAEPMTL